MESRDPRKQDNRDYEPSFEPENDTQQVHRPDYVPPVAAPEGAPSPQPTPEDTPPVRHFTQQDGPGEAAGSEDDGPDAAEKARQIAGNVKKQIQGLELQKHFAPLLGAWKRLFSPAMLTYTKVRLNTASNILIAVVTILFSAFTLPLIKMKTFANLGFGDFSKVMNEAGIHYPYGREFLVTIVYAVILYAVLFALTYFGARLAKDPYNTPQVALERVNYSIFPYMTILLLAFILAFFAPGVASFLIGFGLILSLLVYAYLWLNSTEQQRDRRFLILIGIVFILMILRTVFFRMNLF